MCMRDTQGVVEVNLGISMVKGMIEAIVGLEVTFATSHSP